MSTSSSSSPSYHGLPFRNFVVMSLLFSANHGTMASCQALATLQLGAIGAWQSAILYLFYVASATVCGGSYLVKKIGGRNGMTLGMFLYCIYVGCFGFGTTFPQHETSAAFVGAVFGGIGAGFLWIAQGNYFVEAAKHHHHLVGGDIDKSMSFFAGMFAFLYLIFEVILRSLSSMLVVAGFDWRAIFGVYTAIACVTTFGMMFVIDYPKEEQENDDDGSISSSIYSSCYNKTTAVLQLLRKDSKMKYMIGINATFGFAGAFLNSYVNGEVVVNALQEGAAMNGFNGGMNRKLFYGWGSMGSGEIGSQTQTIIGGEGNFASSGRGMGYGSIKGFDEGSVENIFNKIPFVDIIRSDLNEGNTNGAAKFGAGGFNSFNGMNNNNSQHVGILTSWMALTAAFVGLFTSSIRSSSGRGKVLITGAIGFFFVGFLFLLFPNSSSSFWNIYTLVLVYTLHGIGRATFESTLKATFAEYFPSPNTTAAFGNIVLQNGLASAMGYVLTFVLRCSRQSRYCVQYSDGTLHNVLIFELLICGTAILAIIGYCRASKIFENEKQEQRQPIIATTCVNTNSKQPNKDNALPNIT